MKSKEEILQEACVTWLHAQHPKLLFYHAKNEGNRKSIVMKANGKSYSPDGSRNKKMGVLAGTPDLCIVKSKYPPPWDLSTSAEAYHGFYIELKTPEGRQSPAQKEFQNCCEAEGYKYSICRSIDEFMQVVKGYLE